jgi:hypothetical protein
MSFSKYAYSYILSMQQEIFTSSKITETANQYDQSKNSATNRDAKNTTTFSENFVKLYDEVLQHLLLAFQNLRARIQAIPTSDKDADQEEVYRSGSLSLSLLSF